MVCISAWLFCIDIGHQDTVEHPPKKRRKTYGMQIHNVYYVAKLSLIYDIFYLATYIAILHTLFFIDSNHEKATTGNDENSGSHIQPRKVSTAARAG